MAMRNWVALSFRMPHALRHALRLLSYKTEKSINQIMVETLVKYLEDYPIKQIGKPPDLDFLLARSDPEIKKLLREAYKDIGMAGFVEGFKRAIAKVKDEGKKQL